MFSDYRFAGLLNVRPTLVTYWSNFAVCRFTGYQREGSHLTPNAVILIGGLSSTIVIALAGIYVWHEELSYIVSHPSSVAGPIAFWCVMACIHGTLVWSFTVIAVYVFRGLKNIPMRIDDHGGGISEFWLVERAGRYAVGGVTIITAGAIALSMLPIFVTPFRELSMALAWAQGALIVCFSVLVIRFGIWSHPDAVKRTVGAIEVLGMLSLFILARVALDVTGESGLVLDAARWLRLGELGPIMKYAELSLFSLIAGYLFYRLAGDVMRGTIYETYRKNRLRWYSDCINKAIVDKDFERTRQSLEAEPLWSRKTEKTKTVEWIALLFTAAGTAVSMIDLVLRYMRTID